MCSLVGQIHRLVAEAAGRTPDAPALTSAGATVSYGQLWRQLGDFGRALTGLGLRRGDRVAVYLDKRIENVVALFGASAADCVFVPVNPLLRPPQVGHILRDCAVRALVTSAERLELLRGELAASTSVRYVIIAGGRPPRPIAGGRPPRPIARGGSPPDGARYAVVPWPDAPAGPADQAPPGARAIDVDMAAILYTSGSTGKPKGVVLSHRNLLAGAVSVSSYLGNRADDVILAALPLSFDAGLSQLTTAFAAGAHVVLHNYLLPADLVRLCARHRVTGLTGVPPLWIQLAAQDWPTAVAARLRYFANTGGRLPKATLDRLRALFPAARPYLMYGLTEAFRSTYLDPAEVDRRPDSIGKAIPGADILVVRPDGAPCEPGEEGELVHRGALVALGYWNDPVRTAERFRPAPARHAGLCVSEMAVWSGDIVVRDSDGFLYFVGRRDEMIKTSGYRVSPTEVEEVAYGTGLVGDAVALGLPDPALGQQVVLVVSTPAGGTVDPAVLLAAMKQVLPGYMVPRRVEIRAQIPRSPNGKFDRTRLRGELAPDAAQPTAAARTPERVR
jgi:acyl-CoA ligase (AMP-forming) (exosortase A-associated)